MCSLRSLKKMGSAPAPGAAADALVRRRERASASRHPRFFLYQHPEGVPALDFHPHPARPRAQVPPSADNPGKVSPTFPQRCAAFWSAPAERSGGRPACRNWRHLAARSSVRISTGSKLEFAGRVLRFMPRPPAGARRSRRFNPQPRTVNGVWCAIPLAAPPMLPRPRLSPVYPPLDTRRRVYDLAP